MEQTPDKTPLPAPGNRRRIVIIAGIAILIALIATVTLLLKTESKKPEPSSRENTTTSKEFTTVTAHTLPSYAGNPMQDACGLIKLDTVRTHVKNYNTILQKVGSARKAIGDPLSIHHVYVDRDIPAVLGTDGQPRPKGTSIGQPTEGVVLSSYFSPLDSNCVYGQGAPESSAFKSFARVYVMQKPTPLSADFLGYVATIDPQYKQTLSGFDTYVSSTKDREGYLNALIMRADKGMAVAVQATTTELLQAVTKEAAAKLAAASEGPVDIVYPSPYEDLISPCALLTPSQFQQLIGKPAGAMAEETLYLTEIDEALNFSDDNYPAVARECARTEARTPVLTGALAQTVVTIRQLRSNVGAKKYVQALKDGEMNAFDIRPLTSRVRIGDEAYIKVNDQPPAGTSPYQFEVRIGAAILTVQANGAQVKDESSTAYERRVLPIVRAMVAKYKSQL